MAVSPEGPETEANPCEGNQPHQRKQEPAPELLFAQQYEGERGVACRDKQVDAGVVEMA